MSSLAVSDRPRRHCILLTI